MFRQMPVIVRVHDGVSALGQRYPAEGIAVANPTIEKHQPDERCQKPSWYFESNSDDPFSARWPIGELADW